MKRLKYFVITGFLTLSAFAAVTYSSCTKEACNNVVCLHQGTCLGGICKCDVTDSVGIGGGNCEIVYRKIYAGVYQGFAHNPGHSDTATFKFEAPNDTTEFRSMTMTWIESTGAISFPIQLIRTTPGGGAFGIPKFVKDNKTYIGNGTIDGKTATINMSETIVSPTDTVHNSLSFSNLLKAD